MTIGGNILLCIGLAGEYIARIFDEVRGRPLYVAEDTFGFDMDADARP